MAESLSTDGGSCERTEAGFKTPGARNPKEEENEPGTERGEKQREKERWIFFFLKLLLSDDETAFASLKHVDGGI